MNTINAFNNAIELHSTMVKNSPTMSVKDLSDFDDYVVEIGEALIAEVCDGDRPMEERTTSLVRLRTLSEVRMAITETLTRKAMGQYLNPSHVTVH